MWNHLIHLLSLCVQTLSSNNPLYKVYKSMSNRSVSYTINDMIERPFIERFGNCRLLFLRGKRGLSPCLENKQCRLFLVPNNEIKLGTSEIKLTVIYEVLIRNNVQIYDNVHINFAIHHNSKTFTVKTNVQTCLNFVNCISSLTIKLLLFRASPSPNFRCAQQIDGYRLPSMRNTTITFGKKFYVHTVDNKFLKKLYMWVSLFL